MDCKACGARNMGENRHKLATFIVKNPPATASKNQRRQRKAAHAQANGTDENGMPGSPVQEDLDEDGEEADIITKRINKQAAGLSFESQLANEDWSEDTSEQAVAARMKELSVKGIGGAFAGGGDDDDDEGGADRYESFGVWLEEQGSDISDKEIIAKADELGVLGKYKSCQVLAQVLFNDTIVQQIPKREKLLAKFVTGEKHQKYLLGGIERLVGLEYKDALLKKMPAILMKIYDTDLIEDDVFIKWGEKPSKRFVEKDVSKEVKKASKPFLDWVATAEEESSEEESD